MFLFLCFIVSYYTITGLCHFVFSKRLFYCRIKPQNEKLGRSHSWKTLRTHLDQYGLVQGALSPKTLAWVPAQPHRKWGYFHHSPWAQALPSKMGINEWHPLRSKERGWGAPGMAQLVSSPSFGIQEFIISGSGPASMTWWPPYIQRVALTEAGSSSSRPALLWHNWDLRHSYFSITISPASEGHESFCP